jgi:hypothetical protein
VPIHSILKSMLSPTGRLVDTCDITRGEDDRSELRVINDGRRIVVFVIDAGMPPSGSDEHIPDARSGPLDYFPLGKALDAVDTILDDQRALRAAEFVETRHKLTAALGGNSDCCVVVVLAVHDYLKRLGPKTKPSVYDYAIQNIDPQLYHRIVTGMPLGLDVSKDDVCVLRQAAHVLATTMAAELCSSGQFLDRDFACDPGRPPDTGHAYPCDGPVH